MGQQLLQPQLLQWTLLLTHSQQTLLLLRFNSALTSQFFLEHSSQFFSLSTFTSRLNLVRLDKKLDQIPSKFFSTYPKKIVNKSNREESKSKVAHVIKHG